MLSRLRLSLDADISRFHWSVEYFEDLRNINHCEFILMRQNPDTGKYILENQLRTWSELKKQKAKEQAQEKKDESSTHDVEQGKIKTSPEAPKKRIWGGCPEGCNHDHDDYPRRPRASTTRDFSGIKPGPGKDIAGSPPQPNKTAASTPSAPSTLVVPILPTLIQVVEEESEAFPHPGQRSESASGRDTEQNEGSTEEERGPPSYLESGRDFGGSLSGAPTPHEGSLNGDVDNDRPPLGMHATTSREAQRDRWVLESGMGSLTMADALGDQYDEREAVDEVEELLQAQETEERSPRRSVY